LTFYLLAAIARGFWNLNVDLSSRRLKL